MLGRQENESSVVKVAQHMQSSDTSVWFDFCDVHATEQLKRKAVMLALDTCFEAGNARSTPINAAKNTYKSM